MHEHWKKPGEEETPGRTAASRVIGLVLAMAVGFALVLVAVDIPEEPGGLTVEVAERTSETGVSHPVTAVLLNFRAYDTFLEVVVLILAVLGILAVRRDADLLSSARMEKSPLYDDAVLGWLVRLLAPVLVLTGGYLLWRGASSPGGAFQAGAMLAAAGVALRMAGHPSVAMFSRTLFRFLLLFGLMVFLVAAVGTMVFSSNMLEFPDDGAGLIILIIESALTISIGVILVALFVGAKSPYRETSERGPEQSG